MLLEVGLHSQFIIPLKYSILKNNVTFTFTILLKSASGARNLQIDILQVISSCLPYPSVEVSSKNYHYRSFFDDIIFFYNVV